MGKTGEVKLKQSAVFKNRLPEIESKIQEGMTMKDIAEQMGFKPDTFKKYYQRFKNTNPEVKHVVSESFSHAKNTHPVTSNQNEMNDESSAEVPKETFNDILNPDKRSDSVSEFMTARRPLGKGKNK